MGDLLTMHMLRRHDLVEETLNNGTVVRCESGQHNSLQLIVNVVAAINLPLTGRMTIVHQIDVVPPSHGVIPSLAHNTLTEYPSHRVIEEVHAGDAWWFWERILWVAEGKIIGSLGLLRMNAKPTASFTTIAQRITKFSISPGKLSLPVIHDIVRSGSEWKYTVQKN